MLLTHSEIRRCFAPAKLNLFLHVVGQRADGYHLLQSVFHLLDWGDWLDFELRHDGQVVLATPQVGVLPEDDLVVRAAKRLQQHTNTSLGVTIFLEKNLPLGSGLGGGSSDAATVLLALNRLWQLNLSRHVLMQIALDLGADVPFFLLGQPAFVEGIGEQLTPLPPHLFDDVRVTLLLPRVHVPTPSIFRSADLCRTTPLVSLTSVIAAYEQQQFEFGRNDLEPVALSLYPALGEVLTPLNLATHKPWRMSGSGSTFFFLHTASAFSRADIQQVGADMLRSVSFMQHHPMQDFAF